MRNITRRFKMPDPGPYMSAMMNREWEAHGLHCWSLVRLTVKDLYDIDLPGVISVVPTGRTNKADLFNKHPERAKWKEVDHNVDWAVVLMTRKAAPDELFEHSGVYFNIEGGVVFHVDHPHGCVCDSLFELPRLRKWSYPRFFVPS